MRQLLREAGAGKLAYKYFYKPIMAPATFKGSRGFVEIPLTRYGEYELKRRLKQLTPPSFPSIDINLTFLTGKKYYHQTLLCALSLIHAIEAIPAVTIYDDGSLTTKMIGLLERLIPGSRIVRKTECQPIVEEKLPLSTYKILRKLREKSVLMRKLIDVNLVTPGQVYLDSDMIFWQAPTEIINLCRAKTPFFMNEKFNCKDLGLICHAEAITDQVGITPLEHFNSGIFFTGDYTIDWDFLEYAAQQLLPLPTVRSFLFEQTLYAILFAKISDAFRLPDPYYVAYSSLPNEPTVVTHYVTSMKIPYMSREWYRWFQIHKKD